MNKQKEKYQEALQRLPTIEKQIEQIIILKKTIATEDVTEIKLNMKTNIKAEEKDYKEKEDDEYGRFWARSMLLMTPWNDPNIKNKAEIETGEIKIGRAHV